MERLVVRPGGTEGRQQGVDFEDIVVPAVISSKDIRQASKTSRSRTIAVEGWPPRHSSWLSGEMLEASALMRPVCKSHVICPSQEGKLFAKLIPKA